MDVQQILAYLQSQFPGRLVLYVDDLALILGKSNVAIRHLIERKRLPFQVKNLGGHLCVDIFQVAQWLFSAPDAADEVVAPPAESPQPVVENEPRPRIPRPRAKNGRPVITPSTQAPAKALSSPPKYTGAMIEQILKNRSDAMRRWSAAASSMSDGLEKRFMQALLEKVMTLPIPSDTSVYWCSVRYHEAEWTGWRSVHQQLMHETLEHLRAALLKELTAVRERRELDVVSIDVTQGSELVFSASRNLGRWTIFVDEQELIPNP